jgi:hypothetical protein
MAWARSLAERLRRDGVDASIDQWADADLLAVAKEAGVRMLSPRDFWSEPRKLAR